MCSVKCAACASGVTDAVADEVVDEARAGGRRVAEVGRLDRRGPVGEQLHSAVARVALEIDRDVDAVVANALRDGAVGLAVDVDEVLAGGAHAAGDVGVVVAAVRIEEGLEARGVAAFQQLGHQHRGGVLVEVGRQVADADAARAARAGCGQRHDGAGEAGAAALAQAALLRGRGLDRDQRERQQQACGLRVVAIDGLQQCARVRGVVLPVAGLAALVQHQAQRERADHAVVERDGRAEAFGGLERHAVAHEAQAEPVVDERRVDLQCQRLEEGVDGLARAAREEQRVARRVVELVVAYRVGSSSARRSPARRPAWPAAAAARRPCGRRSCSSGRARTSAARPRRPPRACRAACASVRG